MPTARELLERCFDCAIRKDGEAFASLFANDGTLAFPLTDMQVIGPAAIGARTRRAWGASPITPGRFVIGEVIESETGLTVEYVVHGTVRKTGAAFAVPGTAVLEVANGQIGALREYCDPRVLRAAVCPVAAAADASFRKAS